MRGRLQVDARLIGAGVTAAAAALLVLVLTSPPVQHPVLALRGPAPAGLTLGELDVETRLVDDRTGLVDADEAEELGRYSLAASMAAGAPIPRSLLIAPESRRGPDLLGLELDSAAAVHGLLRPGDLVDVYSATDDVALIAEGVEVVDVMTEAGALRSNRVRLVVSVDDSLEGPLIAATVSGSIHLVRKGR